MSSPDNSSTSIEIRQQIAYKLLHTFLPILNIGLLALITHHIVTGVVFTEYAVGLLLLLFSFTASILNSQRKVLKAIRLMIIAFTVSFAIQAWNYNSVRSIGGMMLGVLLLIWGTIFLSKRWTWLLYTFIFIVGTIFIFRNTVLDIPENTLDQPVSAFIALLLGYLALIFTLLSSIQELFTQLEKEKSSQTELEKSHLFIKQALNSSQQLFGWLSPDGIIEFANNTALSMIHKKEEEVVGVLFWESPWFSHNEEAQQRIEKAVKKATQGYEQKFEITHQPEHSEIHFLDIHLVPLFEPDNTIYKIVVESIDITARRRIELSLKKLAKQFAPLEGKPFYEAISEHIAQLLGIDFVFVGEYKQDSNEVEVAGGHALGSPMGELTYSLDFTPCANVLSTGTCIYPNDICKLYPRDFLLEKMNIEGYVGAMIRGKKGEPIGIIVALHQAKITNSDEIQELFSIFVDRIAAEMQRSISERALETELIEKDALTAQLHQAQKMDAIGQLAGGVAHDFNNMLGGILGAAEMIVEGCTEEEEKEYLEMIIKAARRSGYLTKQLLAFSRKGAKISSDIDIIEIVEETAAILKRTIDKSIEVTIDNQAKNGHITGDDSLLQNALMNMGINASHAMPNGGTLEFTLSNLFLDSEYCLNSGFDLAHGNYIEIAIRDTGVGISPDVLQRIFEPFFTTKEEGKGTGLGLAAVYGMVQEHHGAITVYSEPGNGTVFHIYLPLSEQVESHESVEDHSIPRGSGTILLIDDEELIRVAARAILTSLGYHVILAENGTEGVKTFKDIVDDVDLIILDMIMPVMGGREAFSKLRQIREDIPIIISSGFAKEEDMLELNTENPSGFLRKPFRKAELSQAVYDALKDAR